MKPLRNLRKKLKYLTYKKISYSQEGEDCLIDRLLDHKTKGFYVDVGAHHPIRFSNTYRFYRSGWTGINLDAMPGSMKIFNLIRPRDKNFEYAISQTKTELNYYMFNEPALNGFSRDLSLSRDNLNNYRIIKTMKILTRSLSDVLDEHLEPNQEIDFLNIDVEGLDFEVLKSNNWAKYKPKLILIELLESSLKDIEKDECYRFLTNLGYVLVSKTYNTAFFKLT